MTDKTVFSTIEMRNSKYQGATKNAKPDGFGLLLTLDHLLAITNWKADLPFGPSLIIYPNRNYLYGKIKDRKLEGVAVYVKASG